MAIFTKAYLDFFTGLSANNNKEWFDANRKVYEHEVKKPFTELTETVIARINRHDPSVGIRAGDAIFRINKDIRFSADKTPYKTHMAANISPYGRKNKTFPGFYIQAGAEGIQLYGGTYMAEKDELAAIRSAIADDPAAFRKLLEDAAFRKHFGTIQGESAKRLPPELAAVQDKAPWVAMKQFYYGATLDPKELLDAKLADTLEQYYLAGKPVNDWLARSLKG
jgi:uncharacterized protein (TIGR02453 family)